MKNLIALSLKSRSGRAVIATGVAAYAGSASAAVDTAPIISALTEAGTAAAAVAGAVLLVYVGIKTFKLIKGGL